MKTVIKRQQNIQYYPNVHFEVWLDLEFRHYVARKQRKGKRIYLVKNDSKLISSSVFSTCILFTYIPIELLRAARTLILCKIRI